MHRTKRVGRLLDISTDGVHDASHAGERRCERIAIFDIRADGFDLRLPVPERRSAAGRMPGGDADRQPASTQVTDDPAADEPGSTELRTRPAPRRLMP
jgi:hypothetical protein